MVRLTLTSLYNTEKAWLTDIPIWGSLTRQKNETQGKSKCRCLGTESDLTLTTLTVLTVRNSTTCVVQRVKSQVWIHTLGPLTSYMSLGKLLVSLCLSLLIHKISIIIAPICFRLSCVPPQFWCWRFNPWCDCDRAFWGWIDLDEITSVGPSWWD